MVFNMMERKDRKQGKANLILLEDLVPENHILRKIDKAIDFSFIYKYLEPLYSKIGRPSIDPVILFKLAFLDRLDNRHSMKKTCEEAQVNLAYRWYLGIDLDEKIPHYSDFSKNYTRKYCKEIEVINSKGEKETKTIFRIIFEKILEEAMGRGFIDATHVYMDSTHIKANANKKKVAKKIVEAECKFYQEELEKEIDGLCEENGFKKAKSAKTKEKEINVSTVDEESGVFCKGEHELQVAYLAQTVCDCNGFVLESEVNAANLHDSSTFKIPFYNVLSNYCREKLGHKGIRSIGLDAGYKTPAVAREIIKNNVTPLLPYTRPHGKKNNEDSPTKMGKRDFEYDKDADVFLCKRGCPLTPRGISKETGYITYRSNKKDCDECPFRNQCLSKTSTTKTLVRHIWQKYLDEAELIRQTEYHQRYYRLRSLTIERVFADAKEKHGIRYTRRKGRKRVQDEILLVFACMNLKKMALWIAKPSPQKEASDASDSFNPLKFLYIQFINKIKNGAFQPKWLKYPILSIV